MEKTMEKIQLHSQRPEDLYILDLRYTADLANTWDYGNLGVELEEGNVKTGMVAEVCTVRAQYNVGS